MNPGRWWHRDDDHFACDLCPRACVLAPGQRGFCFVRQATDQGIELTTYGRSSGFCLDPIEKKPLFHFLPGTATLSFGTAGCNLGCKFCQNWEISKAREADRLVESASPEAIARAAVRSGARSVAFTYNDPVIFAEYAIDVAEACHAVGVKTVAVTAGYISPAPREAFFQPIDAANVDLKAFTEDFYRRMCYGQLEPVKDTLRWLVNEARVWTEITTLLIPGENDSDREIDALCQWVARELRPDVPLHFTAFHPDFKLDRPATPASTIRRARMHALAAGLHYVYTGNLHDPEGQATRCASCGEVLIGRDGYELTRWRLRDGRCACGTTLPGRFETTPGAWGSRRMPVRI
ncbi:MAG: AmmeMemoRadiSam system radical SAM enzyme [Deltaproteobacteria bacterium]|nr:AmmeMemoRadiSam system radical SAM enzyme [Deltaproteobacteria bacterium]